MDQLTQRSSVPVQQASVVEADDSGHQGLVQMGSGQVMNQDSHSASQVLDHYWRLVSKFHSSPQNLVSECFSSMFLIAVGSKISIINLTL